MHRQEHSITREGTAAGVLGASLVALWYFIFDTASGHPFRTPDVLGKVLFRSDFASSAQRVVPEVVAGFTVVHFLLFVLAGMVLTLLVHLSTRHSALRMGLWIGLVVAFGLFAGMMFMLTTATGGRLPLWSVVGGTLAGIGGMAAYLWRRHPRLERTFRQAPLGAEERAPAHPPGPMVQ